MNATKLLAAMVIVILILISILGLDTRLENIERRLSRTETQAGLLNAAYQLEHNNPQ
jgi:hypothetical protein